MPPADLPIGLDEAEDSFLAGAAGALFDSLGAESRPRMSSSVLLLSAAGSDAGAGSGEGPRLLGSASS
jgi:hypothetical protein